MPNISHRTGVIATRIDIEAYNVIKRRADKRGLTVNQYCRERLTIDATRKR